LRAHELREAPRPAPSRRAWCALPRGIPVPLEGLVDSEQEDSVGDRAMVARNRRVPSLARRPIRPEGILS
jgi:hypothetical protein